MRSIRFLSPAALAAICAVTFVACGDDEADSAIVDGVLEVELTDFSFGDLPEEVPAGTRLDITNVSLTELHELVAIRLPADDDRNIDEIVHDGLPDLMASGPPAAVLVALPAEDEAIPVVGDGILDEPGRYVLICMIPTGADPHEYLEAAAASTDGPPQVDGGPPHIAHGMYAELVVTS